MPKSKAANNKDPMPKKSANGRKGKNASKGTSNKTDILRSIQKLWAKLDDEGKNRMRDMMEEESGKKKLKELLTANALPLLKKMGPYIVENLAHALEMLRFRVHPTIRGNFKIGKEIQIQVEDAKMGGFLKALSKKDQGDWKVKKGYKTIKNPNGDRVVEKFKLQTQSLSAVNAFISSFKGEKPEQITEQHYFQCRTADKKYLEWIDTSKMQDKESIFEWDKIKTDFMEKNKLQFFPVHIISSKITLGQYVKAAVRAQNGSVKSPSKKDAVAKFTIEYWADVHPKSRRGILRINCQYLCAKDGFARGNK